MTGEICDYEFASGYLGKNSVADFFIVMNAIDSSRFGKPAGKDCCFYAEFISVIHSWIERHRYKCQAWQSMSTCGGLQFLPAHDRYSGRGKTSCDLNITSLNK